MPRLLEQLRAQRDVELELIVADGGSSDDTCALAAAAHATVVHAPRGRGAQMNRGAAVARHDYLLFLHADSELGSSTQLSTALSALAQAGPQSAGHFALRFVRAQTGHERLFRYLEAKTRLNRPGTINGDQGLLLRRSYFEQLGRYDESLPFLEDARIAEKISAGGQWLLLPGELRTSARRFELEGPVERYTLMALMMGLHAAGAHEFFRAAPQAYRLQADAQQLDLRPLLALARQTLRERGRWKTLRACGRYVRQNLWQPFFYRDVLRSDGSHRCLDFYDRRLAAGLDNGFFDILGALLLAAWFYLYLPLKVRR